MTLTRRRFLKGASASVLAGPWAVACAGRRRAPGARAAFSHGVASGDPLADRVILWTRVTGPAAGDPLAIEVEWLAARDPALRDVAARGTALAEPARDYTVRVDAAGLEPGRSYYYRFAALGAVSPVGRTRTLPEGRTERLRLGFASCANYPQGFFNAYARLAGRADLDAVLHLGDYIYEYANGVYGDGTALGRIADPVHEIVTLADYRSRYACYRSDPDLQELHRQHPVIAVWDDHELANNAWRDGAENHQPAEGAWGERKAAAVRAWQEWMPVRTDGAVIHRSFRFGDLAHLCMLDARLSGRDAPVARGDLAGARDPGRSLLGREQEAWLAAELQRSARDGVAWRVLGQQVVLAPLALAGQVGNADAWDGFRATRERLLDHLQRASIGDVVVLTGDVHSSWAIEVARDPWAPDARAAAVEFVAPAVSSSPLGSFPGTQENFERDPRPNVRYMDLWQQGYAILDLDRERAQAEWWYVPGVTSRAGGERLGAALRTPRGASRLERVADAAPPLPDPAPPAP